MHLQGRLSLNCLDNKHVNKIQSQGGIFGFAVYNTIILLNNIYFVYSCSCFINHTDTQKKIHTLLRLTSCDTVVLVYHLLVALFFIDFMSCQNDAVTCM